VKRILPALVACVLVTAFLGALVINPQALEYACSMSAGFFALFGASNIYFFQKATDYFGTSAPLNLFTQTWSLGVEEQLYLVFPLLLWVIGVSTRCPDSRHGLLPTLFGLTLLSLGAFVWLNLKPDNGAYFLMAPRFWELSLGCMIAVLPRDENILKGPRAIWPRLLQLFCQRGANTGIFDQNAVSCIAGCEGGCGTWGSGQAIEIRRDQL
jgi:peptidoglycan/LPS O-acetylase OafA/YrhL